MSQASATPNVAEIALEIAETSLQECKSAHMRVAELEKELEVERERVKKASAQEPKIIKVAFNAEQLEAVTAELRDAGYINEEERIKLASHMQEDPNAALGVVRQLIQFSTPSYSNGVGVPKSASIGGGKSSSGKYPPGWEEDGLHRIIEEGP